MKNSKRLTKINFALSLLMVVVMVLGATIALDTARSRAMSPNAVRASITGGDKASADISGGELQGVVTTDPPTTEIPPVPNPLEVKITWQLSAKYTYTGAPLTDIKAVFTDDKGVDIILAPGSGMTFTKDGAPSAFQNAGSYVATINIGKYTPSADSVLIKNITIDKQIVDISNMKFYDIKKDYNAENQIISVAGVLNNLASVAYFNEDGTKFTGFINDGEYIVNAIFTANDPNNYELSGIPNNTLTAKLTIATDLKTEGAFISSVERIGKVNSESFNAIKLAILNYTILPYTGNVKEAKAVLDVKIAEYNAIVSATNDCMSEAQGATRKIFDAIAAVASTLAAAYAVSKFIFS